ncbi:unnamed protein product [Calypogeia fissa]
MKGAPKFRAAMRRRAALGSSAARCCYRICYILLVVAAVAALASRLRGARLPPGVSNKVGEKIGIAKKENIGDHPAQEVAQDSKQEHLRRWIVKPNSLCFGKGNITILSVAIGLPQDYLELLRSNRLAYAGTHNYRYCEVQTTLDFNRQAHWTKVKATSLLLSFADTVMHIDADALIVNHSVTIQSIMESSTFNLSGKDVIYTSDFKQRQDGGVDAKSHISSAVYIMRSTAWSKALLEAEHKFDRDSSLFNRYEEIDALNLYRMKHAEEYAQHVGIVPFKYMNSPCSENYNYYEPGDFIAHFTEGKTPEKYVHLASRFKSKSPHDKRGCSTCECFLETPDQ